MLAPMSAARPMLQVPQFHDILSSALSKSPTAATIISKASALTGFSHDPHAEVAKPRLNLQTLFGSVSPGAGSPVPRALAELSPTARNTLFNTHNCQPDTILQIIHSGGSLDGSSAKTLSSKSDSSGVKQPTFVLAIHPGTPYPHSAIARLPNKPIESILKNSIANMNAKRAHPSFPPAKTQHVMFSDKVAVIDEEYERQQTLLTPATPLAVMPSPRYSGSPSDGMLDRALHPLRQANKSKMLSSLTTMIAKEPSVLLQSKFSSTTTEASSTAGGSGDLGPATAVFTVTSPTPCTPDAKKPRIERHAALFDSYSDEANENWAPEP